MKYIIFLLEVVAFVLWYKFGFDNIWLKILGFIVIIGISQFAHTKLNAR